GSFDAGMCPQAQALPKKLEALAIEYDRCEARARARIGAAEKVGDLLAEPERLARSVTFWRWFRRATDEELVPPQVMDAALRARNVAKQPADADPAPAGNAKGCEVSAGREHDGATRQVVAVASVPGGANSGVAPSTQTIHQASARVPDWVADMSE